MVDVLETGLLEMGRNDGVRLLGLDFFRSWGRLIFVIVVIALAGVVLGTFMLMGWAELQQRWLVSCSIIHVRSDMK